MKVTIETEDPTEARRLMKALDLSCVIFEIQNNMKKRCLRYIELNSNLSPEEAAEYIFEQISDSIHHHEINIDDILE